MHHRFAGDQEVVDEVGHGPQTSNISDRLETSGGQPNPGSPEVGPSSQQWEQPTEATPPSIISPRSDSAASLTPPDWRAQGAEQRPASKHPRGYKSP